jgi:uncharacterized protein (DUF2062 family)
MKHPASNGPTLAHQSTHWVDRLRTALPTRHALAAHPWLRPVAGRILDPQLWRLQHEAVARGVAIGIFWAFVIPVAQVVVATVHCTWWRGNIPAAAAVTLVTNPLTIGFWLWLAYQLGGRVLGESVSSNAALGAQTATWLADYGWPIALGMGLFAVGGSLAGYISVKLIWRLRILVKRRQRRTTP